MNTFKIVMFASRIFIIMIKSLRDKNKELKNKVKYLEKQLCISCNNKIRYEEE